MDKEKRKTLIVKIRGECRRIKARKKKEEGREG